MPQDDMAISAVEIMQFISESLNLKKKTCFLGGVFIYLFSLCPIVRKGYGGVSYSMQLSQQKEFDYVVVSCKEGLKRTVLHGVKYNNSSLQN